MSNKDFVITHTYQQKQVYKAYPLISIIVASYNYEQYISQTLDSLINQTYTNFEIIVVDDGSNDNSPQIIKEYEKKHENLKYFEHESHANKGLSETVKFALEHCSGEYIAFCESDDYWSLDHLEKKVECINKFKDADIIVNPIQFLGDNEVIKRGLRGFYTLFYKLKKLKKPENMYIRMLNTHSFPCFSCVMVKSDILKKCDFKPPQRNGLDIWLWRQLTLRNKTMYVDKKMTFWRKYATSNASIATSKLKEIHSCEEYYDKLEVVLNYTWYEKIFYKLYPYYEKYIWHTHLKNDYLVKRLFKIKVYKKKISFEKEEAICKEVLSQQNQYI